MNSTTLDRNPRIAPLLFWVTAAETLVLLVAGVGLLVARDVLSEQWPWHLTPLNALLMGAIYTGSMIATFLTVYVRRWAPARVVMPMIFLFTAVVLIVSLLDLKHFDFGKYGTWLWFFLYVVIPVNAAYHIWLNRHLEPVHEHPMPRSWRTAFLVPPLLLGLYGVGLLLAPEALSGIWPWVIGDFHARMYSVLYMTPAMGALLLWRSAASIELMTMGLTVAVGAVIPLVGLGIADRSLGVVNWSAAGTWLWLGSFAVLLMSGVGLLWRSTTQESTTEPVSDFHTA